MFGLLWATVDTEIRTAKRELGKRRITAIERNRLTGQYRMNEVVLEKRYD